MSRKPAQRRWEPMRPARRVVPENSAASQRPTRTSARPSTAPAKCGARPGVDDDTVTAPPQPPALPLFDTCLCGQPSAGPGLA